MKPYWSDDLVTLYHGDFRDVLPELGVVPDLIVADPPYGETSLAWEHWPTGWSALLAGNSMWCFGSMRMFLDRRDEFASWRISQDLVWEKQNGSGFSSDRHLTPQEVALDEYEAGASPPWTAALRVASAYRAGRRCRSSLAEDEELVLVGAVATRRRRRGSDAGRTVGEAQPGRGREQRGDVGLMATSGRLHDHHGGV